MTQIEERNALTGGSRLLIIHSVYFHSTRVRRVIQYYNVASEVLVDFDGCVGGGGLCSVRCGLLRFA